MKKIMTHTLAAGAVCVASLAAGQVNAQDGESLFGVEPLGLTYGPYMRAELGYSASLVNDGFWESPGATDPIVFFDLDGDDAAFGSFAYGFDWMNGIRADVALSLFGKSDIAGDWSFTVPATPGPHASVAASVSTTALMGNVYYAPFEAGGQAKGANPYVTAGLGISRNKMSDWTRTSSTSARPVRTFQGNTNTDVAWSVGAGATWQVEALGSKNAMVDFGVRYFDLGEAVGGLVPLPGNGTSSPRQPLTIDMQSTVISVGIRIPLYN